MMSLFQNLLLIVLLSRPASSKPVLPAGPGLVVATATDPARPAFDTASRLLLPDPWREVRWETSTLPSDLRGCDHVLVRNPDFAQGLGLQVHIRTTTFIEAVALKIGDDTLEVTGDEDTGEAHYWINGVQGKQEEDEDGETLESFPHNFLSGFKVVSQRVDSHQSLLLIDLGQGDVIGIETFKSVVRVKIHELNRDSFHNAVGLMGPYPNGNLVGRDGITVMNEDVHAFSKEWQVLATEPQLFREGPPMECTMLTENTLELRRLWSNDTNDALENPPMACTMPTEKTLELKRLWSNATNDALENPPMECTKRTEKTLEQRHQRHLGESTISK